jgi:hypothetical protein
MNFFLSPFFGCSRADCDSFIDISREDGWYEVVTSFWNYMTPHWNHSMSLPLPFLSGRQENGQRRFPVVSHLDQSFRVPAPPKQHKNISLRLERLSLEQKIH